MDIIFSDKVYGAGNSIPPELDKLLDKEHIKMNVFGRAVDLLTALKQKMPRALLIAPFFDDDSRSLDVIRLIREEYHLKSLPIITLGAPDDDELEAVLCYEAGADVYLPNQTPARVIAAQIRSVNRLMKQWHQERNEARQFSFGSLLVDVERHTVEHRGTLVKLTMKEFELLTVLVNYQGMVLSRESLLNMIWGYDYLGESRTIDVHIKNIRKALSCGQNDYIETVRGIGYRFTGEINE